MRRVLSLMIMIGCLFVLQSCSVVDKPIDEPNEDIDNSSTDPIDVEPDDPIDDIVIDPDYKVLSWSMLLNREDEYFVYYYSPLCCDCANIEDLVYSFHLDNALDIQVYYLDESTVTGTKPSGIVLNFFPAVLVIKNGEVKDIIFGVMPIVTLFNQVNDSVFEW